MKRDMIYDYSKKESSIIYLKDGFEYLHLKKIKNMDYKEETKYKVFTLMVKYTEKERKERTNEIYHTSIHGKELKILLEELKNHNYPVYIGYDKSVFYYNKSEYLYYEGQFTLYTYRRNILLKKLNKGQKRIDVLKTQLSNLKNGFIDKIISYFLRKQITEKENKLNSLIEKELINYISDIRTEFDLLRLPKELFDELKTHTLLSGKNQIEKTTIILDDILEKFFRLHYVGKTTNVINGYDLLIKSSYDDMVAFIQEKIELMKEKSSSKSISAMNELSEEEMIVLKELKNKVFKEQ